MTRRPSFLAGLAFQCLAWIALCFVYHAALRAFMLATGRRLGWVSAEMAAPLHAWWQASPLPWLVPALVVLGLVFLWRDRVFRNAALGPVAFVLVATGLFVSVALATALMDGFVRREGRLIPAFAIQHSKPWLESFGDVPKLESVGFARFGAVYSDPRRLKRLANHSRSHPPGPVFFQWATRQLLGARLLVPPLSELGFGAALIGLTYLLGRELYDERVARLGVALTALAPNVVMFATSMDLPFAAFLLLAAWLVIRAVRRSSVPLALASGLAMAVAAYMTFSVIMLVVLLGLWLALEQRRAGSRPLRALGIASLGALTCLAAFFTLTTATGYHVRRAVAAQTAFDARLMGTGTETTGVYWALSLANLMAFAIGAGAPVVVLALRGLRGRTPRDGLLVAAVATAVLFAFSSLYSLEVERIWLFLTPLLALGGARVLVDDGEREFGAALLFSCVLLFAMESCLLTAW